MRIVWGLVWIAIGTLIIKFTFGLVQTFGQVGFAEKYLSGGLGGTYTFYKIMGLVLIFLGFLYMFGGFGILTGPLQGVFGGGK